MFLYTWDNKKGTVMPDLRIKPNVDNGDLPEQMELFDGEDKEMNWLKESFNPSLMDIFNPALLRQKFENINGHTNKDKDKQ
jgi:hypothetical protein